MAKPKISYACSACGFAPPKWVGRCPECGDWGTIAESGPAPSSRSTASVAPSSPARRITDIDATTSAAVPTGIGEFDRVLGSGVVPGSVILLAGEPGVGKSTLLLETVKHWARQGNTALYITGEESAGQVRLRAERTGAVHENIFLASETDLATILGHVDAVSPTLLIVDSVQTVVAGGVDGVTGGVTQIRAATTALVSLAKSRSIAVVLVGHVTKDGNLAGPRSLEHLVDVVLSFEGDKHSSLRMIRGIKNRFGASDEVGCFEQHDDGIHEVPDPSGIFLHQRSADVFGSVTMVTMDGKRALVGEVQALANGDDLHNPRRAVSGLDTQRIAMILAVLQANGYPKVGKQEVYVSTVGGMKVTEPAVDLAVALAVASFVRRSPVPQDTVVIGELGLAGEVRRVTGIARRLAEAKRLGFARAVIPAGTDEKLPAGIQVIRVSNLDEAITAGGGRAGRQRTNGTRRRTDDTQREAADAPY